MTRMRRMLLAALVVAPLAAASPAAARQARIVPARLAPLEIRGSGFHRWERVRVTVTPFGGRRVTRRVRANRHGSFRVTFLRVSAAGGIEATAAGRRGSRASFSLAF
jgi:hypothetical protein